MLAVICHLVPHIGERRWDKMQNVNAALHERSVIIVDIATSEAVGCLVAIWQKWELGFGLENVKLSHALLQTCYGPVRPMRGKEVRRNSRILRA